jgi:TRAP-type mannitol/chloroaromatic compound transport system substrate-binding protein
MQKCYVILFSAIVITALLVGVTGCRSAEVYHWKMATSWTADHQFFVRGAQAICERVKKLSGGRLIIDPLPAGQIGALEVMDAVSKGKVEMGHSWSGYWLQTDRSFELFTSIPNQMIAQEYLIWLYGPAGGLQYWRELYAPYHIVPLPGGLVGPEFGFFTKTPVRSLEDFKGLKLRVSGLASQVVEELGATTVLTAPGDIKKAMQKGDIDGFEFSTPGIDWPMGFQDVAPYISLPSWHQPSAMFETLVNQSAYNRLPADLQAILESACKEVSLVDFFTSVEGINSEYLTKYEQYGTQIYTLDNPAILKISEITNRLADEEAAQNPFYAKVLASQRAFIADYRKWETWGQYSLYPAQNSAEKTLSDFQKQLAAEMGGLKNEIAAAAQKMAGLDMRGVEARALLSGLVKDRPYVVDACTVDRNARLAAAEPGQYSYVEGQPIGDQEQVMRLFRTRQAVLSWNFRAVEGFDAADIEVPVFSDQKDLVGAVSVLFKPDVLLGQLFNRMAQETPYTLCVMQPDGRLIYDPDEAEVGLNLFVDSLYQAYPQLITLGRQISVAQSGSGRYQFLDSGLQHNVTKDARWVTFSLLGVEWRLILMSVVE